MNARKFALRWADAWNRKAVEEVLENFHDEIVFVSPTALKVTGAAVIEGKDALRAYWLEALGQIRKLRFDVKRVLWDPDAREIAILYTAVIDGRSTGVSENLIFNKKGLVKWAEVYHGAPVGAKRIRSR